MEAKSALQRSYCGTSFASCTGASLMRGSSLLDEIAEQLRPAERRALGVPLDDHAALIDYVTDPRLDPFFETTTVPGKGGRPRTPPPRLAVIVATVKTFEGQPVGRGHKQVADLLGVTLSTVRDAPERLKAALRSANPSAPADVLIERYARFVEEAGRVLEELRNRQHEAAAARTASRRAMIHAEAQSRFSDG